MLPTLRQFYEQCIAPEIIRGNLNINKRCIDPPYIQSAIAAYEEKKQIRGKKNTTLDEIDDFLSI